MDFQRRLLSFLEVGEEEAPFLLGEATLSDVPSIEGDPAVKKALSIIEDTRSKGGKCLVYGDYDCDGATSASILFRSLSDYGLSVRAYLPSRYVDGYGISSTNAEKIARAGYSLVVTVDNGIAANEPIAYLKSQGLSVIVIDHHEIQGELPMADAIVHPQTIGYPSPSVSAGYLSYLFSRALLGKSVPYLLVLGALSTLSDMMELKKHNLALVRLAEKELASTSFPALSSLGSGKTRGAKFLSYEVAPAVNAVGRMEERPVISRLVDYLSYGDKAADGRLLAYVLSLNEERKELSKKAMEELSYDASKAAVSLLSPYQEGLSGLIANRIMERYEKPTAVFARKAGEEGILVGSLRSREGTSLLPFFASGRVPFVRSGGHALAAGVSIREEDFPLFEREFALYALAHPFAKLERPAMEVARDELTLDSLSFVERLGPYGHGHEEPRFVLPHVDFDELSFLKDGKYLAINLSKEARIFSFRLPSSFFAPGKSYALSGTFERNSFRGRDSLSFLVDEAKEE